jgi:hypothetical protein
LIDIETAIDKVIALMNKNKTDESTAHDTNENPDTTQESNSVMKKSNFPPKRCTLIQPKTLWIYFMSDLTSTSSLNLPKQDKHSIQSIGKMWLLQN